ncbi:uncharacterized protein ARMOST_10147 [Armillaria ostoyae]|uniref:Uncharacterized protein n=1 Tax=Armillaria ostoyae TaxID=47428 RepID=A0A284RDM5_ARMOS|nr:uncharacterized protein ARMOST_10147 [Armillaria ostoyae]
MSSNEYHHTSPVTHSTLSKSTASSVSPTSVWRQEGGARLYHSIRGYGSDEDSEPLLSTFPGDYDPLSIDNINMKDHSESKGRGTVVAVDLQVKA